MKNRMNYFTVFVMTAALCLSFGCGVLAGEKKALPTQTEEEAPQTESEHYKSTMKPFEELVPSDRIVILQNTLNFGSEGFYTEDTKPVTEAIVYQGAEVQAYPISYTLEFLNNEMGSTLTVTTAAGEQEVSEEDFAGMYVIIDDFQSGNMPVLYNPQTGTEAVDFLYAKTENNEAIYSIITEQDANVQELLETIGWDTTQTYRLVATDKFYIPITPEDYDDGELRGALSGAINASFPDMIIAGGKMNDILYFECIVE